MNRQFLLAACLATALPGAAQAADVMVHGAFARATPPGAQVGGVFFEMMNRGEDARLVGGQTDVAADVQIHTHSMDSNGIMRMRELEDGLPVPAGETVVLQPGGLHVMLIGLTQRLAEGETLDLTLEFADGTRLPVAVPVARISAQGAGAGHGGHQGHDMKAMDHGTGQAKTKHAHQDRETDR